MFAPDEMARIFQQEEAKGIPPTVREHLHAAAKIIGKLETPESVAWFATYQKEFAK